LTVEGGATGNSNVPRQMTCPPGETAISDIALNSTGEIMYSAAGSTVRIWDLRTYEIFHFSTLALCCSPPLHLNFLTFRIATHLENLEDLEKSGEFQSGWEKSLGNFICLKSGHSVNLKLFYKCLEISRFILKIMKFTQ